MSAILRAFADTPAWCLREFKIRQNQELRHVFASVDNLKHWIASTFALCFEALIPFNVALPCHAPDASPHDLSVLEAHACGTTVVVPRAQGFVNTVNHGVSLLFFVRF